MRIISECTIQKANELLSKMTLEEKIGQMCQYDFAGAPINPGLDDEQKSNFEDRVAQGSVGSIFTAKSGDQVDKFQRIAVEKTRLGIPLLVGRDIIHGHKTVFPIPVAQACSFNADVAYDAAKWGAHEGLEAGVRWVFGPMVDVARDPRWGRIAEGPGEDTHLAGVMAKAAVEGTQADDLKVISCPKHYVAYGAAESGRDYNTVDMSEQKLREIYLPPFKKALEAGALTIMSAFHEFNGVPVCANKFLMTDLLKEELGFEGFIVSDYNAVAELMEHGLAATAEEACLLAVEAGLDMDMQSDLFYKHLPGLVRSGRVPMSRIDDAVRRILSVKLHMGLFERPYRTENEIATVMLSEEARSAALNAAIESAVLLANDGMLPLSSGIQKLAVIGPLADNQIDPMGCWVLNGESKDTVSLLSGLKEAFPNSTLIHEKGCDIKGAETVDKTKVLAAIEAADAVILAIGESLDQSGEAHSRTDIGLPGYQEELAELVLSVGKPVATLVFAGRPLVMNAVYEKSNALLYAWHLGTQSGKALAQILSGTSEAGGRLAVSIPVSVGQIPVYYNRKRTGRPPVSGAFTSKYIDLTVEPMYPFGFGLSYTTFEYANLRLSSDSMKPGGSIEVSVDVKNAGTHEGTEVVQLYLTDKASSVTRPIRELKGFKKIALKPQETQNISFTLKDSHLGFHNQAGQFIVEAGAFTVQVGRNSNEGLTGEFNLVD